MKNKKIRSITLLLTSFLFLLSCEKTEVEINKEETNSITENSTTYTTFKGVEINNNLLDFETVEDYYDIVNDPDVNKRISFTDYISNWDFNNYFSLDRTEENKIASQEMDEFFGQLLNQDGCIQIENHIYKIDLVKERVFVIESSTFEQNYEDLIKGNVSNDKV